MSSTPSTVSFTVRRPTPVSRPSSSGTESDGKFKVPALPRRLAGASGSAAGSPLAGSPTTFSSREESDDDGETGIVFQSSSAALDDEHSDSSDEDGRFATNSDRPRTQRLHQKKKNEPEAPLIIPSQPNPDWREAARKRRAGCARVQPSTSRATPSFVPDSARATTGADGSVGGLGTRDTINSGPQLSGLQIKKRVKVEADEDGVSMEDVESVKVEMVDENETEDQRALRAILAGEDGSGAPTIDIIPVPPLSEADALKQDMQELPDVATAQDYERVPISAFGVAMLRGMGWTEGTVASKLEKRKKSGLIEPYLPQARPALLGIGAKEREPDDDGSTKKKSRRPELRYVPVARKDSGRESEASRSGTVSRRGSRSPSRREADERAPDRDRERYDDRDRRKDHDQESSRRKRDYDDRPRDRRDHRDRDRDMDRDRGRDRDYSRDKERERKGRGYDDRDRTRERDRREYR